MLMLMIHDADYPLNVLWVDLTTHGYWSSRPQLMMNANYPQQLICRAASAPLDHDDDDVGGGGDAVDEKMIEGMHKEPLYKLIFTL